MIIIPNLLFYFIFGLIYSVGVIVNASQGLMQLILTTVSWGKNLPKVRQLVSHSNGNKLRMGPELIFLTTML